MMVAMPFENIWWQQCSSKMVDGRNAHEKLKTNLGNFWMMMTSTFPSQIQWDDVSDDDWWREEKMPFLFHGLLGFPGHYHSPRHTNEEIFHREKEKPERIHQKNLGCMYSNPNQMSCHGGAPKYKGFIKHFFWRFDRIYKSVAEADSPHMNCQNNLLELFYFCVDC